MHEYLLPATGQRQRLAVADLIRGGADTFRALLPPQPVALVYSDPPWNPGNEKWWRRHAGVSAPDAYAHLCAAWASCAAAARPGHVLVEQAINPAHQAYLLRAIAAEPAWALPYRGQWVAQYGSPLRPNAVLHYGPTALPVDPTGLHGKALTRCIFGGLRTMGALPPGWWVADPCTGLGTTSRMAHEFGGNFLGTELAPHRLARTAAWLERQGYQRVTP